MLHLELANSTGSFLITIFYKSVEKILGHAVEDLCKFNCQNYFLFTLLIPPLATRMILFENVLSLIIPQFWLDFYREAMIGAFVNFVKWCLWSLETVLFTNQNYKSSSMEALSPKKKAVQWKREKISSFNVH